MEFPEERALLKADSKRHACGSFAQGIFLLQKMDFASTD